MGGYTCFVDEEGLYKYAATNPNPALEDLIGAHELRGDVFVLARETSALKGSSITGFSRKVTRTPCLMIHQPEKFTVEVVTYLISSTKD